MNDMHEHAEFSEHAAKNRRIWEANAGWAGVLRQYAIGVVWGSFLKRCPFLPLRCNKQRTAAKGGTKRKPKVVRFSLESVRGPIRPPFA
jgi:hypothetical protein